MIINTKNLIKHIKGPYSEYDSDLFENAIYFAEDKKKIIVDGIEYGLDLESDEVDLISNIDHKDNKLTITFSNGKIKEIELEDHRAYWEELPSLEKLFPNGGCIINTQPIKKFSFKGGNNKGKWYSSDGQEGKYDDESTTTITFKEEGEYTLKFVSANINNINSLKEVTDNSVKSVLMIGGSNGETYGVKPVNKNENAKLIFYDNITSIGSEAFQACTGFTGELKLPESLISIGDGTFYNCTGFTGELKLPESLISIGGWAFYYCKGFTGDLIIPDNITSIGDGAFQNCKGFTKIYVCEDTELNDGWNAGTQAEVIKYKKGEKPGYKNNII